MKKLKQTFKKFITLESARKKVEKCKLDINFLFKCRESNLYPTFTKVKCLKDMNKKVRNRYHRRLLLDEISNIHKRLKSLNKQLPSETDTLKSNITWMKVFVLATVLTLL